MRRSGFCTRSLCHRVMIRVRYHIALFSWELFKFVTLGDVKIVRAISKAVR